HSGCVRPKLIQRISRHLLTGIKSHGRPPDIKQVNKRLQDEHLFCDRRHSLQCQEWVTQVIEHTKEKHNIKRADRLGRYVEHIKKPIFHTRLKMPMCKVETRFPQTSRQHALPDSRIDSYDTAGASAL